MSKKYEAMVLSCIDPRFQKPVHKHLKDKKLTGKFSAFTIAGGSIGVTNNKFKKWHSTFWENLETSINLHKINKLIILNHNDCGAAKIANNNKNFNSRIEIAIHKKSFNKIKKTLKKKFPKIKVSFKILSLKNAL
jgi:carbonic anhydrase